MIRPAVTHIAPAEWFLAFRRSSPVPWVQRLPGRFKHVACFGLVPGQGVWLFVEPTLTRCDLAAVPDRVADRYMEHVTFDAVVVRYVPPPVPRRRWWWPGLFCTGAVAAVVGLRSGALRPDRLFRDCLADGGEVIAGADDLGPIPATEHAGGG